VREHLVVAEAFDQEHFAVARQRPRDPDGEGDRDKQIEPIGGGDDHRFLLVVR
jgi:hypothetical protein